MQDPLSLTSLVGALLAGVLSVLSPCVLPLMPAYLSLISGISVDEMQSNSASRSRVLLGCLGFFLGFTAVFVALGASASAVGRLLVTWNVLLFGFEIRAVQVAGLIIPFFLAGASLDTFLRWFASVRRHLPLIKILSGCFLVAIGMLILTNRLAALNSYFTFMNRIVEAAEALLL